MYKYKLTSSFLLFVYLLAMASCSGNNKKIKTENIKEEASLIEVSIGGMSCLGCEQTIQRNVAKLEGVKSVKASYTVGNAIIEYFPAMVDTIKIKEAVTGSGYTVKKFISVPPEETTK
jgi:copper chaperone